MANGYAYDGGGPVTDTGGISADLISLALASVDRGMDYGRNKYGLTSGGSGSGAPPPAQNGDAFPDGWNGNPNWGSDFRRRDDIEDRRGDAQATMGDTSRTKFDDVADRARETWASYTNPMSQQLGINDVGSQGAIPDQEEGQQ